MPYETYERAGGEPVELYHFTQGEDFWTYTTADQVIVKDEYAYVPAPISRDNISVNEEARTNNITLTLPTAHELTSKFKAYAPSAKVGLIVYRVQRIDPALEWTTLFKGEIKHCEMGLQSAVLTCVPIQHAIERRLLNVVAQPLCNNRLYDERCQVDRAEWTFECPVEDFTAIIMPPLGSIPWSANVGAFILLGPDADTLFADDASGFVSSNPYHWLMGGVAQFGNQKQMIAAHVGTGIWLLHQFTDIEIGDLVTLYAGCDKIAATCRDKFDNLPRFLGFPYMPIKNPFGDEGIA